MEKTLISNCSESKTQDPLISYIVRKDNRIIATDGSESTRRSGGAWIIATEEGNGIISVHNQDFGEI